MLGLNPIFVLPVVAVVVEIGLLNDIAEDMLNIVAKSCFFPLCLSIFDYRNGFFIIWKILKYMYYFPEIINFLKGKRTQNQYISILRSINMSLKQLAAL